MSDESSGTGAIDLNHFTEETDALLTANEVPIYCRPIVALKMLAEHTGKHVAWGGKEAEQINAWYTERYGERVKAYYHAGEAIVLIRGNPYKAVIPLVYGTVKVNPFTWIQGVTDATWKLLTKAEIDEIGGSLMAVADAFNSISCLPKECTADFKIAIDQIMLPTPETGLSRWASLQAAEKTFKAFISKKGEQMWGHDLGKLNAKAVSLGLQSIPDALIAKVQCDAGIRYNEVTTSLSQAIESLQASIEICKLIAEQYPVEDITEFVNSLLADT